MAAAKGIQTLQLPTDQVDLPKQKILTSRELRRRMRLGTVQQPLRILQGRLKLHHLVLQVCDYPLIIHTAWRSRRRPTTASTRRRSRATRLGHRRRWSIIAHIILPGIRRVNTIMRLPSADQLRRKKISKINIEDQKTRQGNIHYKARSSKYRLRRLPNS